MKESRPLFIFLHVPKTGGTTINVHLSEQMKFDEEYVHIGNWGSDYRKKHGLVEWEDRPQKEKNKARFLAGHGTYFGIHKEVSNVKPYYILVLRDPLKRFISGYNFNLSGKISQDNVPIQDIISYYNELGRDSGALGYHKKRNVINRFLWKMNMSKFFRHALKLNFFVNMIRRTNHLFLFIMPKPISHKYDQLIQFFQYKSAMDLVNKCWLICATEDLDDHLPYLFTELGVSADYSNYRVNDIEKNIDNSDQLMDVRKLRKFKLTKEELESLEKVFVRENNFDYLTFRAGKKHKQNFEKS